MPMCDCGLPPSLPPSQPLLKWLPLCSSTTGLQPGTSRLGLLQLGLRGHTEPSSSSEIICRSQRLRLILFYCPRLRGMNACCGWKRVACCSFPLLMIINTFCSWKRVICFLFPVIDRRMSCVKPFGLLSRAMEEALVALPWWCPAALSPGFSPGSLWQPKQQGQVVKGGLGAGH